MQIDTSSQTFEHDGNTFNYEIVHRQTLTMGSVYAVTIKDDSGTVVARDDKMHLLKGIPADDPHGLGPQLVKVLQSPQQDLDRPAVASLHVAPRPSLKVIKGGLDDVGPAI